MAGAETVRTLCLSYFGLRAPLVQTQVLPYLRQLVAGGIEVALADGVAACGMAGALVPVRNRPWTPALQ